MEGHWVPLYVSARSNCSINNLTKNEYSVKDHPPIKNGYKTRLWCSQDVGRKKKSKASSQQDIKSRDTMGMHRYDCNSSLVVTCRKSDTVDDGNRTISINLHHEDDHVPYFDVEMPSGASDIIRDNLEWSTPASLVTQIQALYPNVTAQQIRTTWTQMSETLWKRDQYQLSSAETLLREYSDEVDIFDIPIADGVEQLCWGMKKVASRLKGMVVEIGIDATCAYKPICSKCECESILTN